VSTDTNPVADVAAVSSEPEGAAGPHAHTVANATETRLCSSWARCLFLVFCGLFHQPLGLQHCLVYLRLMFLQVFFPQFDPQPVQVFHFRAAPEEPDRAACPFGAVILKSAWMVESDMIGHTPVVEKYGLIIVWR